MLVAENWHWLVVVLRQVTAAGQLDFMETMQEVQQQGGAQIVDMYNPDHYLACHWPQFFFLFVKMQMRAEQKC